MSSHDDKIYLQHILESIQNIEEFTSDAIDSFHKDTKTWFATIRALQIMAESVTKISEPTKAKTEAIDWQRIKGFRNILVHDYLGNIDYQVIRAVIQIELPKLKTEAKNLLSELEE